MMIQKQGHEGYYIKTKQLKQQIVADVMGYIIVSLPWLLNSSSDAEYVIVTSLSIPDIYRKVCIVVLLCYNADPDT